MLHSGTAGAVVAAPAQLGIEGVEDVGVDGADLEPTQIGRDVRPHVAAIERLRALGTVELVEVARPSSWSTVAFVRGSRRSAISASSRSRTTRGCRSADGPAGIVSDR
jgi:hypothetical protein